MLTYDLSQPAKRALYERLYLHIREDIANGAIKAGEHLPSKRALAGHLGISVTTVEKAYEHLLMEGYIYSKPSSGYFALEQEAHGPATGPADGVAKAASTASAKPDTGEYDMDFHGNLCGLRLFPITIWTKLMRRVLSGVNRGLLETVPWNGLYPLRAAISDYLRRYRGIEASPDLIVIGAGTEYLYGRLLQLFARGTLIAFPDPGYDKLSKIAVKSGMTPLFIPQGPGGIDTAELVASAANIVHLSPANQFPTGTMMPLAARAELLEWADSGMYRFIIEDDYDSEFSYQRRTIQTLYSMCRHEQVIYINTFSKSLVPSLRISYMILPKALHQLYRQSQDFYSCTVSSFEQMTLALFISEGYFERHLRRLQGYYGRKRDLFYDALGASSLNGIVHVSKNLAGTHMLVRVQTSLDDDEIRKRAAQMRIHLRLLTDYCRFPSVRDLKTLVVNYAGMEDEDVARAVRILEQLFSADLRALQLEQGGLEAGD